MDENNRRSLPDSRNSEKMKPQISAGLLVLRAPVNGNNVNYVVIVL